MPVYRYRKRLKYVKFDGTLAFRHSDQLNEKPIIYIYRLPLIKKVVKELPEIFIKKHSASILYFLPVISIIDYKLFLKI